MIGGEYLGNPELGGGEHVLRAIVTHPALCELPFVFGKPRMTTSRVMRVRSPTCAGSRGNASRACAEKLRFFVSLFLKRMK